MEAPSFEGPLTVIWNDNKVFGEPSVTRARMCEQHWLHFSLCILTHI
jgi:hypothetical protein